MYGTQWRSGAVKEQDMDMTLTKLSNISLKTLESDPPKLRSMVTRTWIHNNHLFHLHCLHFGFFPV